MKTWLKVTLIVLLAAGMGMYAFREPLKQVAMDKITAKMFVARDADAFNPGVAIGESMPVIRAQFKGREVASVNEFSGTQGTVLFLNRSVDW